MAILSFKKLVSAKPILHFVLIVLTYLVVSILFNTLNLDRESKWICIFSILIFYCWLNPMIGAFSSKNWINYTLQSTAYILLFTMLILTFEYYFGNDYLIDSFEYTMLLLTTFIFYTVAIGICGLLRMLTKVLDKSSM